MELNEKFNAELLDFKSNIISSNLKYRTAGVLLFKDYLSKMHMWYKELGLLSEWDYNIYKTSEKGHNLLNFLTPELKNECIELQDFRHNYLNDVLIDTKYESSFEYIFIYISIYWKLFQNEKKIKQYSYLPNPYESVIKILQRGNHIYKGELNRIEIDNMPVKKVTNFILPSLDNDFLNYVDTLKVRYGSSDIPNQEEINQLWKEFQKITK